jgi:hypothetical protein
MEVGTNGLAGHTLNEGPAVILQVLVIAGMALSLELSIQAISGSVVCHDVTRRRVNVQ